MESLTTGTLAGTGSFRCEECGYVVTLAAADSCRTARGVADHVSPAHRCSPAGASSAGRATSPRWRSARRCSPAPGDDRAARPVPGLGRGGERAHHVARPRVDAHRTQPGRRRALRRPHGLAPPRADRAPGRRRAGPRRPQPERRVRQRRARRVARAVRRRRDRRRALPPALPRRGRRPVASDEEPVEAAGSRTSGRKARGGEGRRGPGGGIRVHSGSPSCDAGGWRAAVVLLWLAWPTRSRFSPRRAARARPRPSAISPTSSAARASTSSSSTSTPRATCRTTSTSTAGVEPTIGDVLTGRATAADAVHDGIIPANLSLAEAELQLAGKMGRELTLRKALKDVDAEHDVILIDCPPALGPADGQRARRRRLRAAERRGAVLRAAGRRAGARGHRARPRRPQPRPRVARRAVQHRRHAHRPLARGLPVAAGARRRQAAEDRGPPVDRLRGVLRARRVDPRPPRRPRLRLHPARRRAARAPAAHRGAAPAEAARRGGDANGGGPAAA